VITGIQGWADGKWLRIGAKRGLRIAMVLLLLDLPGLGYAQKSRHQLGGISHSSTLTFMAKDGSCFYGPIAKIDPKSVTITAQPPVTIQRNDLLQVSQGNALVFSARSSWADVEAVHLLPRESFRLRLHNGKIFKDRPLLVTTDGMVFKRFLWMTKRIGKDQIVTVDYLRMKPESDAFDYFAQEAPALLFFYPEFYDRLAGLEGRIPVRLYDAVRPQDDAPLKCLQH
jgi:hypothetical protein